MKLKSKILIIAGSDSSGGAGVQADIKTVTSLGSYALTAITAVTIQNTLGVKSVISLPPNDIKGYESESREFIILEFILFFVFTTQLKLLLEDIFFL